MKGSAAILAATTCRLEAGATSCIMEVRATIDKLERREDLTRAEARSVLEQLLSGSVPDAEIMALLVALRDKGERMEELVGFAEVMRTKASEGLRQAGVNVESFQHAGPLLDTCGTGGDEKGTFNVSTATALVVAGGTNAPPAGPSGVCAASAARPGTSRDSVGASGR